jgi:hypothetical protein
MRSVVEHQIRLTIASPLGQAATDAARRTTYTASLIIYEQLLDAAKTVPHTARPLPVFYALSQAGRAIVAAHGAAPTACGHGLAQDVMAAPVTKMKVKPTTTGLFRGNQEAIGSSPLTGPVELGAL